MDSCTAVTADLMGLIKVRLSEVGLEEFDVNAEDSRIHMMLDKEYAQSIFSSTRSKSIRSHRSSCSLDQKSITAKRAECAAQLAAKQAEINMEEAIATQRLELKRLENQRDLQVIAAKLRVYSEDDSGESCNDSIAASSEVANCPLVSPKEIKKWRTSFKALIERRCTNPADKLL